MNREMDGVLVEIDKLEAMRDASPVVKTRERTRIANSDRRWAR
jgi:hypothetical protein